MRQGCCKTVNLKRTLAPKETTTLSVLTFWDKYLGFLHFLTSHSSQSGFLFSICKCFPIVKSGLSLLGPFCYIWHHFIPLLFRPQQLLALMNCNSRNELSQWNESPRFPAFKTLHSNKGDFWRSHLVSVKCCIWLGDTNLLSVLFLCLVLLHLLVRLLSSPLTLIFTFPSILTVHSLLNSFHSVFLRWSHRLSLFWQHLWLPHLYPQGWPFPWAVESNSQLCLWKAPILISQTFRIKVLETKFIIFPS